MRVSRCVLETLGHNGSGERGNFRLDVEDVYEMSKKEENQSQDKDFNNPFPYVQMGGGGMAGLGIVEGRILGNYQYRSQYDCNQIRTRFYNGRKHGTYYYDIPGFDTTWDVDEIFEGCSKYDFDCGGSPFCGPTSMDIAIHGRPDFDSYLNVSRNISLEEFGSIEVLREYGHSQGFNVSVLKTKIRGKSGVTTDEVYLLDPKPLPGKRHIILRYWSYNELLIMDGKPPQENPPNWGHWGLVVKKPMERPVVPQRSRDNRPVVVRSNTDRDVGLGRNKKVDHQKPKSGGRSDPNDKKERTAGDDASAAYRRIQEKERRKHEAEMRALDIADKAAELDIRSIVKSPHSCVGWDGKEAYGIYMGANGWEAVSTSGMVLPVIEEGTLVDLVRAAEPGVITQYSPANPEKINCKAARALSAIKRSGINVEFTYDGKIWSPAEYDYFVPFLNWLQKQVSTSLVTESITNAMMASLNRLYPNFPDPDLLINTISFYKHSNEFKKYRLITGYGRITKDVRDRQFDQELLLLGEVVVEADVAVYQSVDCEVPDTYPFRNDCSIVFREGANSFLYSAHCPAQCQPDNPRSYPRFEVADAGANSSRYIRSVYLGFSGPRATSFQTYSVNATNACKALKRMCGARESLEYDDFLTGVQYSMFFHILDANTGYFENHKNFLTIARLNPRYHPREIDAAGTPHGPKVYAGVEVGLAAANQAIAREFAVDLPNGLPLPIYRNYIQTEANRFFGMTVGRSVLSSTHASARWLEQIDQWELKNQMAMGFSRLMEDFNYPKLTSYADTHPKWIYREACIDFMTYENLATSRTWLSNITHVKKALRKMFVEREVIHSAEEIMVRQVEAKVKKEFAKVGKVPRLFVTYGGGCMYANELPEFAKVCLDGMREFKNNGITFKITIFAKPSSTKLTKCFKDLIHAMQRRDEVYILIYSDDSVWTGNINGVDFAFNVDISSCDSGNKGGVFGLIYLLLSKFSPELALGLVSQCGKTIRLANPENEDHWCDITMASLFEGSGTVLTTILNHVAMYMVAQAAVAIFAQLKHTITSWQVVQELIVRSGEAFGHVLSVEPAMSCQGFIPEKIQFLKRSPMQTETGEYIPAMNYGPIFRGFGSVEGDLTAEMVGISAVKFSQLSRDERTDLFLSRVVAGLVHEPTSIVVEALRRRFCSLPSSASGWDGLPYEDKFISNSTKMIEYEPSDTRSCGVTVASICRRYDIDSNQLGLLTDQILSARAGRIYPSDAIGAFAKVDYGCGDRF